MKKIIILILSTRNERYEPFIVALRETWVKKARAKSIECFFYEGGHDKTFIDGDIIKLNVNDDLNSTSEKLIYALKTLKESEIEFDYIYRTNLSSFIFIDNLIEFFNKNGNSIIYSGYKGKFINLNKIQNLNKFLNEFNLKREIEYSIQNELMVPEDVKRGNYIISKVLNVFKLLHSLFLKFKKIEVIEFASGSGFWINRACVEILLSNTHKDLKLIDDVMVGKVMANNNIKVMGCDRVILQDEEFISNNMDVGRLKANYHVRLKSFKSRDIDVKRMYMLDKIEISDNIKSDLINILNC
jgi:hypothetical protein